MIDKHFILLNAKKTLKNH